MSYTTCLANDHRDRRDRDCKLVGFTTTYAIDAYHLVSQESQKREVDFIVSFEG
jgi:hypothetical protein